MTSNQMASSTPSRCLSKTSCACSRYLNDLRAIPTLIGRFTHDSRAYNTGWIAFFRFTIHKYVFHWGGPRLQRKIVEAIPYGPLQELREMVDIMDTTSKEILESTKRALAEGKDMSSRIGGGKDIMSILGECTIRSQGIQKLTVHGAFSQGQQCRLGRG